MRFSLLVSSALIWGQVIGIDYSRQECTDAGGVIVGDIGDGAIFQPTFTCSTNGEPPMGNVVPGADEQMAIEGEVCCGTTGDTVDDEDSFLGGDDNTTDTGMPMDDGTSDPIDDSTSPPRPEMSRQECEDENGIITYDIGDGSIHRADYLCDGSGMPPIGTIIPLDGESISREGEVCCPPWGTESPFDNITTSDPLDDITSDPFDNSTSLPIESPTTLPIDDDFMSNEMSSDECLQMGGSVVGILNDSNSTDICLDSEPPIGVIVDSDVSRQAGNKYCCANDTPTLWPEITRAECEDLGGVIEGDIGDGATQSANYTCTSNGQSPIGTVVPSEGEPIAIEGEVCCEQNATEPPSDLPDDDGVSRIEYTREECEQTESGVVEGDIGDGATQQADYICASNGLPPIGNIVPAEGEATPTEGEVCCGANTSLEEPTAEEPTADPVEDDSSSNHHFKFLLLFFYPIAVYLMNV